jgi:hypothetical protein
MLTGVGLITTSPGTADRVLLLDLRASAGEVVEVAVLLTAQ